MVSAYGMSDVIGPIGFGEGHDEVFVGRDFTKSRNCSEEVAATIDREIKTIIDKGYKKAESLLTDNVDVLHKVAQLLLEKEKLDAAEFETIFNEA